MAHSLLCAIALIQNTLPPGVVHDDAWAQLVSAAVTLSTDAEMAPSAQTDPEMPPSAQPAAATPATPVRRRTLSPPSASSPKRRRQEPTTPEPTLPGGEENQSPAPAPAAAPQDYVVKVSNNNRRAERERNKKQAAAAAKSKCSVGLLEPAESDGADEKIAYHQIQPADNADVAWIIKQPVGEGSDFYQKTESPYLTASTMLAKAREVGSKSTWPNLAAFLQAWREYGTPVPGRGSAVVSSQTAMQLRPGGGAYAFQQSYYTSCVYKQRLAAVIIEYRWAMAFLGRAYHAEIRERGDDRRHVKTQIIDALWELIEPSGTEEGRKRFVRHLTLATRWYQVADTLGWGSLCLLPDAVSNKWVKACPAHVWPLWLQLVKRVNPDACAASRAFDAWIGSECIEGGPIQRRDKLYIEREASAFQVEEVIDSTDDESSEAESSTQLVKGSARRLRQLTLLELLQPQ